MLSVLLLFTYELPKAEKNFDAGEIGYSFKLH